MASWSDAAEAAYEAIRADPTDVERIASLTGFKVANISKVKHHLFFATQILDRYRDQGEPDEIRRFDADPGIAVLWSELASGIAGQDAIKLLRHEIAEAWYMQHVAPGYSAAHEAAQARFPSPLTLMM